MRQPRPRSLIIEDDGHPVVHRSHECVCRRRDDRATRNVLVQTA